MARKDYDIEIVRGETYDNDIEFDAENGIVSLEGKTAKAQIRPKEESDELIADMFCSVDASKNIIHVSLNSAQTTAMRPGKYSYDVFLIGNGFRKCYLGGQFIVRGRTTVVEDEKLTITGEKTWEDEDNADGIRPESITIRLLANGVEVDSKTVTAADGWMWRFENLDIYSGPTTISYSITEDPVEGYTTIVSGYNVTNHHDVIPE